MSVIPSVLEQMIFIYAYGADDVVKYCWNTILDYIDRGYDVLETKDDLFNDGMVVIEHKRNEQGNSICSVHEHESLNIELDFSRGICLFRKHELAMIRPTRPKTRNCERYIKYKRSENREMKHNIKAGMFDDNF